MRVPSDLPRRPSRSEGRGIGSRGRIVLIAVFAVLFVLFISARSLAGFYVETLWFNSVGRSDVFWGVLRAKFLLSAVFTVAFVAVSYVSLTVADRMAPLVRMAGPEEQVLERYRDVVGERQNLIRLIASVVFGLVAGLPAGAHWQDWMLFRNAISFASKDEQFGTDVGFYVFRLPFLNYLVNWLFAAFLVILLLTALAHYLNGGIRVQPGGRHVTPQVKLHLSALLVVLALLKAADYWLQRFELTTSTRGYVDGATYTDVKAQLPALQLLILISLLAGALLLINVRQKGWRLPVIAVGLWLVVAVIAGTLYPAVVQRFQVEPSESTREAEYIGRNIRATRAAMGIDQVDVRVVETGTITGVDVEGDVDSFSNVRLLDPNLIGETFDVDQGIRTGYRVGGATRDIDVDRYEIDGRQQQVVLAARQLDLSNIPLNSWEGEHLAYTHGYGLAFAPASTVDDEGKPNYVSVISPENDLELTRPEIYYGDGTGGYSVVGSDRTGGEESLDPQAPPYSGTGGVELSSRLRRAAFAVYYGEYNLFGSRLIKDSSRIIYRRDVRTMVEKVAPFLRLDSDPYPVVSEGRLVWVLDAYTTSSRYPYAQNADTRQLDASSGLRTTFNYVRNSVKAAVDAYDGTVTLYLTDPSDPIVNAWQKTFPELFVPVADAPTSLREHFRYPEDLFRVQTNAYGRYQLKDADDFYTQSLGWSVAQETPVRQSGVESTTSSNVSPTVSVVAGSSGLNSDSDSKRFEPYYSMFRAPGAESSEFVLLRPFVPWSRDDQRKELAGFMTASSDPDSYGKLTVYSLTDQIAGPLTVASQISQEFSQALTQYDLAGTHVEFGDLQVVPVADKGFVYVRPWLLVPDNSPKVAKLISVSVTYNGISARGDSIGEALENLFAGIDVNAGDRPGSGSDSGTTPGSETTTSGSATDTVEAKLSKAQELYDQAQAALADFDSKGYADLMNEAYDLLRQAAEQATGQTFDTPTVTVPDTSDATASPTTTVVATATTG